MKRELSPTSLNAILATLLVLLIVLGTGGFIYLRQLLATKATETSALTAQAASGNSRLQALSDAKKSLEENDTIANKINQMIAQNQGYEWQKQFINNISTIATNSGVQVSSIDFTSSVSAPTTSKSSATGTTIEPATTGGIKVIKATVSVKNPVRYDKLLVFIHSVEQSTLSLQIARVSITNTGSTDSGYSMVNCDTFTIGVYVR